MAHVREELADVLVYCRNMLDKLDLDEDEIINEKMSKNEAKYPVDKAREKRTSMTGCDRNNGRTEPSRRRSIL